jgi:hypothetical protein
LQPVDQQDGSSSDADTDGHPGPQDAAREEGDDQQAEGDQDEDEYQEQHGSLRVRVARSVIPAPP